MTSIRRLLVVSTEDSTKLSSWSNVPYLFCKNLESKGIVINRLTLKESMLLRRIVAGAQKLLGAFGGRKSTWSYSRSATYFRSARKQIDRALKQCEVDAVLILSFSYGPSFPLIVPLFMFGDWSYGYAIERQRERVPNKYESLSIEREHNLIAAADDVFVLFPLAEKYLRGALPQQNTHYLGNVINAVEQPAEADINLKRSSFSLLFVGKPHYLEGAQQLIDAYRELKKKFPQLVLNIVGMGKEFFGNLPEGVFCHGYLDKGNPMQRAQYYSLLRGAKLFVNSNPRWASFSAALEAMYFYTPLVSSAYTEMEETFGKNISFGSYYQSDADQPLHQLIETLMTDKAYESKARNAHVAASPFSWTAYVERFLNVINKNYADRKS